YQRYAALIAAVMMTSTMMPSVAVFAEETSAAAEAGTTDEAKALEKVILDVKSRVDIPADLDKFEYDTNTKYGTTFYTLRWYKEGERKYSWGTRTEELESIKVSCFDGFINGISHRKAERESRIGFPKMTEEQQKARVKELLYKTDPGLKGDPVIERDTGADVIHSSDMRFTITRPISGIPFDENSGHITIDKDTGELISMDLRWWNKAEFPDASKRITPEKACEIFKSRKPLGSSYELFSQWEYDEETDEGYYKQFIRPVYQPKVSGENEIDAITGEYTKLYEDRKKYSYTDAYDWSDDFNYYEEEAIEEECDEAAEEPKMAGGLSSAELAAVEDESKYMSYEELLKKIKDDPFIVFNDELVNTSNYTSTYTDTKGEEQTLRVLAFSFSTQDDTKDGISLRVEMDAVTGEIVSFSKYYSYGKKSPNRNTTPANKKKVQARATAAAKHFMGDKAYEYRITGGTRKYDADTTTADVYYTRFVNDLEADFDDIRIEVDSRDEVLSFEYTYHDMEFPKPEPVGEDKAYEMLFEKMQPDLYYTGFTDLQLRPHTYLTYRFDSDYMIDMNTGKRLTYNGEDYYQEEVTEETKVIAYTDIKGHKYEKEIQTLLDYGIYCTDASKLDPDGKMTAGEFTKLWDMVYCTDLHYPYADKWDDKAQRYVTNKESLKPICRGEIAKIYLREYGSDYFKAAEVKGIYKSPYKDVEPDSPYIGYITFAKALELIDPDSKTFGENKGYTRGDMLKLAYDYLAGDEQKDIYDVVKI
ncbi:MAG: hypothetical protein IKR73_08745, partial [Oscillospiraceae bacterium]|nr:hypothetical protein [Oscillospiraceae bacterium]